MSRERCSNCGKRLSGLESDLCNGCKPYVDIVDGLLIPTNQSQSLYDFYRERIARGHDVIPRQDHEQVKK